MFRLMKNAISLLLICSSARLLRYARKDIDKYFFNKLLKDLYFFLRSFAAEKMLI